MKPLTSQTPWYFCGLAFECTECGRCCSGPEEGYVWATAREIAAIAQYLNMTETAFRQKFVRKVRTRHSLVEDRQTKNCVFLEPNDQGGQGCAIYPVRPLQCRTWPFWSSNLDSPEAWAMAQVRCQGINRGPLCPFEEIEARRNATRE